MYEESMRYQAETVSEGPLGRIPRVGTWWRSIVSKRLFIWDGRDWQTKESLKGEYEIYR